MTLRVLEAGLQTLVVDFGRPSTRSRGVPVGGAADRGALALGNGLVGNPPDAPALEITLAGPTLEADCDLACVVYGAPFELTLSDRKLTAGKTFTLRAGVALKIGGTAEGMRAYFCVAGGLDGQVILGSRSGLKPVSEGDELPCRAGAIHARYIRPGNDWIGEGRTLRVVDGAQADWFAGQSFFDGEFTVTADSNRMGLRLQGEPLEVTPRKLTSEAVCPGSVQVTRNGQCIVLGVDGQTIGGYPKIAQVIAADLDKLGQLRPGDAIRWVRVTLEEATRIYRRREARLREWLCRLQVAEVFI
jgi:antagonist of KipI